MTEPTVAAGSTLPPYEVVARNLEPASENRIHDDTVARRYGFEGGLVPGVVTYAYMTRPVAAVLGLPWLERGTFDVRLVAPVYDGDLLTVSAVAEAPPDGVDAAVSLEATNAAGHVCATGRATLPRGRPDPPDPSTYAEAPLPAERPPATRDTVEALTTLGTVTRTFRGERAPQYLDAIGDDLGLYRPAHGPAPAHPGWVVYDANQALARNLALGPWIHVSTEARHFDVVVDGDSVATRGRVAARFEKRGHQFVVLDLLVVATRDGATRPVWHLTHTAIYQLARA